MNRGVARRPIFDNAAHGRKFVKLLGETVQACELRLHAYCLMPNHFHLLLDGPTRQLTRCMQLLGSSYARYYNWSTERDGPLFRSRFHCKPVGTAQYAVAASRYIHRNPIGRVAPKELHRYPWSSMRCYVAGGPMVSWLETDVILGEVGGRREYVDLVVGDRADCPVDVGWAIGTAIADVDLPARLQAKGLDDSIAAALLDRADPVLAELIHDWIGLTATESERLRAQARRRAERNPELNQVIDRANILLGRVA